MTCIISELDIENICNSLTNLKITREEKVVYVKKQLYYKAIFDNLKILLRFVNVVYPKQDDFPWDLLSLQLPGGEHFIQISSDASGGSFMIMPHFHIPDFELTFNNIEDTAKCINKLASLAEQGKLQRPSLEYLRMLKSDGWIV
jgi:hypothetical protein